MPQWAGSSWILYDTLTHITKKELRIGKKKQWFTVDLYIGGAEHAVLHLLLVSGIKVYDLGVNILTKNHSKNYLTKEMTLGEGNDKCSNLKEMLNPDDVVNNMVRLCVHEMFMGLWLNDCMEERLGG